MSQSSLPALPSFGPRPQGIPIAPFSMQKTLSKMIRSHGKNTKLSITAVKGADKMGGKRSSSKVGRASPRAASKTTSTGKTK